MLIALLFAGLAAAAIGVLAFNSARSAETPAGAADTFFSRLDANLAAILAFLGAAVAGVLTLISTILHTGLVAGIHFSQLVGDWPLISAGIGSGLVAAGASAGMDLLAAHPLLTFGICLALVGIGMVIDASTAGELI